MKKFLNPTLMFQMVLICIFLPVRAQCAKSGISVKPLYKLSDFSGTVPYKTFVRMTADQAAGEILILDPITRDIRIYNSAGMEIYRTEPYRQIGTVFDFTVKGDGTIDLLVNIGESYSVKRCNYRGEIQSELVLTGIPEGYSDMWPSRILWDGNHLYLADLNNLKVAVFENDGRFVRGYMIGDILQKEAEIKQGDSIFGIAVDQNANLYFTIPTKFRAYRLSPEGRIAGFGMPGSSPGRFSVVSGVAVDGEGNIFLTDRNRCVVMVYGPDLHFLFEFGRRGPGRGSLVVPGDLVFDAEGKLYVSQLGQKGIQVYRVMSGEGSADGSEEK